MDLYVAAERLMAMDDATWRRHANPWSAWTRFSVLPLLAAALWSRAALGWWALVPVALVLVWAFINPRLFQEPDDFGAWASRGVLGERVFLDRGNRSINPAHLRAAHMLTVISAIGIVPFAIGLWTYDLSSTVLGIVLMTGAKMWFVDRMVWIHVDATGVPLGEPLSNPVLEAA